MIFFLSKALQKLNAQYIQKRDYSVEDETDESLRYILHRLLILLDGDYIILYIHAVEPRCRTRLAQTLQ